MAKKEAAEKAIRDVRRKTRRRFSRSYARSDQEPRPAQRDAEPGRRQLGSIDFGCQLAAYCAEASAPVGAVASRSTPSRFAAQRLAMKCIGPVAAG